MKIINYLAGCILAVVFTACAGSEASLQKYYIDNQDNKDFLSIDIPASIISLKENVDPEAAEAYKSLKKMNVLAFKKDGNNELAYQEERKKVNAILKNDRYVELMRVNDKGRNFVIKYEGDEDTESFDEVVLFASDKTQGFALVRILGDDMSPKKFLKLTESIKNIDSNNGALKELEGFIKGGSTISID